MDGRGRALDNIFVERLWRSVKYEDIYLKDYVTVPAYPGPGRLLPILQRSTATSKFGLSNAGRSPLDAVKVSGEESTLFLAFGGLDNGVKYKLIVRAPDFFDQIFVAVILDCAVQINHLAPVIDIEPDKVIRRPIDFHDLRDGMAPFARQVIG